MNKQAIIIVIGIFVLLIVGMFVYSYIKQQELRVSEKPSLVEEPEVDAYGIVRIDAKHFFRDGTHTVAGEIPMPTPCDLLTTDYFVAESFPEQVTINFDVINNSEGLCAQVITPQRFKVSFDVDERASISATFRGERVILNLIEAGEGEDPDDFELFIKG